MACSQPGKRLSFPVTDHDIISSLPVEIKHKILLKMPIKVAVKTSILSTKWRYTWASMPELVLRDDELVPDIHDPEAISRLVKIVDLVLFLHKGVILKFDLSTKHLCAEAFDRWILNLSRNGLAKFTFRLNLESKYRIPSNFFLCNAMKNIHLSNCFIKLPQNFEGFKLLDTLNLKKCIVSAADIEQLVSSSPKLQKLLLITFHVEDNLKIHAPKLKQISVIGEFLDLQIDAPNLTGAFIGYSCYKPSPARIRCLNKLCRSLCGLQKIRKFGLLGFSISYLAEEPPAELLKAFSYVKHTVLDINFANKKESCFLFSLLQNAHNLRAITLIMRTLENTTSSSFGEKDIVFKHLETVTVNAQIVKASEPVLALVKYILGSAPILRKLTLNEHLGGPKEKNPEVFKRLLQFRRASPKAEIIFSAFSSLPVV